MLAIVSRITSTLAYLVVLAGPYALRRCLGSYRPLPMSTTHEAAERRFIRACWRKPVDCTPVWLMRASRSLYARISGTQGEVLVLRDLSSARDCGKGDDGRIQLPKPDAAIIFSDIMIPALAMGLELDFAPGPKLNRAIQTEADVASLKRPEPAKDLDFVMNAIELTRAQLPDAASLIGFVGAPLTLAAYLAEGRTSKNWVGFKSTLYDRQPAFEALLDRCVETVTKHALAQVDAGCDAIQLFDTNAGMLHPIELEKFALPAAAPCYRGYSSQGKCSGYLLCPRCCRTPGDGWVSDKSGCLGN